MRAALAVAIMSATCAAGHASAAGSLRYNFSGTITLGAGSIAVGDPFTGSLLVDLDSPPSGSDDGVVYQYQELSIEVGSEHFSFVLGLLQIDNDGSFAGDRVDADFNVPGVIGGLPFTHGRFRLVDTRSQAVASNSLHFSTDLSRWNFKEVRFYALGADVVGELSELAVSVVPAACPADLNGDLSVEGKDLAIVLSAWGTVDTSANLDQSTSSPEVDGQDLAVLLANWGSCLAEVPTWATMLEAYPDPEVVVDAGLRESIISTGYAWRVIDTASQIELVLIPPGSYQMGCSSSNQGGSCAWDENPAHTVTLTGAFYLGRYEVTQAEWTARMGSNPSWFQSASTEVSAEQVLTRPVEQISWNMIQGFLSATGMRLPTEAEWEYAYRAGTTTAFHSMPGFLAGTSDVLQIGTIAWWGGYNGGNSKEQTRPVGQLVGNGFGLHDMSGNVKEWVNDWWSDTYYASSPLVNPPGPQSGSYRVLRGGSWNGYAVDCRSSRRIQLPPTLGLSDFGFRVARDP